MMTTLQETRTIRKKDTRLMEDFDSFDQLDSQIAEEKARNSRFQNLLTLSKDGDIVTFRLLKEALPFKAFKEHSNYDAANKANCFHAVCAAELKKPCEYCTQYEKTGAREYRPRTAIVYPVFVQEWQNPRATSEGKAYLDTQIGQTKLWIIKAHAKQTQHHTIREFMKRYGTALSGEWQLSRRGEKKETTYSLAGYQCTDATQLPLMSAEDVEALLYTTLPPKILGETESDEPAA